MKYKIIIIAATLFILNLLFQGSVLADTTLAISPSVVKVISRPGANPIVAFDLENKGDPVLLELQILPFTPLDSTGHLTFGKEIKDNITFDVSENPSAFSEPFLLKSNTHQHISLQMHLPDQLVEKDYYFTLLTKTTPFPSKEGETTLRFVNRIGANILLTVTSEGTLEQKASIPLFTIPESATPFFKNIYDTTDSVPVTFVVKNDGRNVIKPHVFVSVNGWNIHQKYTLKPENILANSQRLFIDPNCASNCNDSSSLLLHGFFIGKYSVTATVRNSPESNEIISTTTFIALPFKTTAFIILSAIIVFFLLNKLKRKD